MLIEGKSQYLLKKVRAKAKMYEYHIPEELHGTTEKEVVRLLILAVATIGDFSNEVVDNYSDGKIDYKNYQNNLRFSSKFFDAYLDANLCSGDPDYYLLLGAIVYYLCDYNGSSKVLASRIENVDLKINGIDSVIKQILLGEKQIFYNGKYQILDKIIKRYNAFLELGAIFNFSLLTT